MKDRDQLAENIKRLLNDERITQKELAETILVSPITVNKWVKGRMGIREHTADAIHEHYPEYSTDFLRGFTEYKNDKEADAAAEKKGIHRALKLIGALDDIAETCGIKIEYTFDCLQPETGDDPEPIPINERLIVSDDSGSVEITIENYNALTEELMLYVFTRLSKIIERGGW